MGNQASALQPQPTSHEKSKHSKEIEDGGTFGKHNMFDDGLDGLYDTIPVEDHFVEVGSNISKNSEISTALNQKSKPKSPKIVSPADDNNLSKSPELDLSQEPIMQAMSSQPSQPLVTTHTLARDAGVVGDHMSKENLRPSSNSLLPQNSDRLASAIRWPIKRSKDKRSGPTPIPKSVQVVTSVDHWKSKITLSRSHDDFVGILDLPEGRHRYRFIVDGQEMVNTDDRIEVDPKTGERYNYINIEKSDFDIFNALEDDDNAIKLEKSQNEQNHDNLKFRARLEQHEDEDFEAEEFDDFCQDVPDKNMLKKIGQKDKKLSPALLPPHLLQKILLNEEVHQSYEPSLLPEPQHVMLNHLYALAIRNGVMALSATGRYKKKFVTTLLYKPL